jgi:hypothetical protein
MKTTIATDPMTSEIHCGIPDWVWASFQAMLNPVRPMVEPKRPIGRYSSGLGAAIAATVVAMNRAPLMVDNGIALGCRDLGLAECAASRRAMYFELYN